MILAKELKLAKESLQQLGISTIPPGDSPKEETLKCSFAENAFLGGETEIVDPWNASFNLRVAC